MKHILQFSYLYPNLSTLIVLLILGLFVYFFARFLAFVFSSAEKKNEPEPSIMTNIDKLKLDLTVITTDRDELKQHVTQLEQYIEDNKELYNSLIDDYNESLNKVAKYRKKLGKSYSEIARLKAELRNCKLMIQEITIPDPSQLYVAADSDGLIHAYKNEPTWTGSYWTDPKSKFKLFVAYDICYKLLGKIQRWDEDPTQVEDKVALIKMIAKDIHWVATNIDGKIYMYIDRPFRNFEKNVWVTLSTYAVKASSSDIEQKIGFVPTWWTEPIPVTVD